MHWSSGKGSRGRVQEFMGLNFGMLDAIGFN